MLGTTVGYSVTGCFVEQVSIIVHPAQFTNMFAPGIKPVSIADVAAIGC